MKVRSERIDDMGLDISHDAWHGAYSSFTRWRHGLAKAAGYQVLHVDWGHLPPDVFSGDWGDTQPDDPLLYLIAHSDCDGVLSPDAASRLADRLEELLPNLPVEADLGHIGDWREKTQKFIDGCRLASTTGEQLEFY